MTKIYGHRGMMGDYPENTLLSFEKALQAGVDGLELDVHVTSDGELVVIHDASLNRTTSGVGLIQEHSLEEIRQLHINETYLQQPNSSENWLQEKVPTLKEVLDVITDYQDVEVNIELKTYEFLYPGIENRLIECVNNYSIKQNIIFSSFHLPTLMRLKAVDEEVRLAWIVDRILSFPNDYLNTLHLDAIHLDKAELFRNFYHWKPLLHLLRVWTVNEIDEIKQLLDVKVNAIITDYPERALHYRRERYAFI